MVQITNLARGPRGFNVKGVGDASAMAPVILHPGESAEIDLHDEDHPTIQGMLESGEIVFGKVAAAKMKEGPGQPGPDFDKMPDDALRTYIEERTGGKLDGKIDRKALMAKAKDLSGKR